MPDQLPDNSSPSSLLARLERQLAAVHDALLAQHAVLQGRGLMPPLDAVEGLAHVRNELARLEQRVAVHAAELARARALAKTAQMVNSMLELDDVLQQIVDSAIALTGAERGFIALQPSRTGTLEFSVARECNHQNIAPQQFAQSKTILNEVARTGQPFLVQDAQCDSGRNNQTTLVAGLTGSIVCVPLIFRERVTGMLYADHRQMTGLFGESEMALLVAFARQSAIAVENARLFDRARRTLSEITELKDMMDNVFASITSGVITIDNVYTILTCNQAAGYMLGTEPAAAIGRPLQAIFPGLVERAHTLIEAVSRENTPQTIEIEPILPGRGPVTLNVKLTALQDVNNITYGLVVVVDDLTEIKQRDAMLNVVRTYLSPDLVRNIQSIDDLGLSGDQREVSIIFADVRGFTTFSELLPPEELMSVITRYLTVASDAIELYDGIVDKYMGDAVVGLFNTQLNPQPDHAIRAVRAALSMAYDVRALHETLPPAQRLFYGIGIDSGVAMLGNVGSPSRKEFTAIGRPFNLAKLLEENALAGEIMISKRTQHMIEDRFDVEMLKPRKTKGYTDFRVMFRVTGVKKGPE